MDAFPAFIPLAGKTVIVVGEGETADAKARLFDGSPARLLRMSLVQAGKPGALEGAALVFVAGPQAQARSVADDARAAGALVNVVDIPALGDFTTPSIVDRGRVVGAVGTDGSAPVLAVRLRQQIETLWPERLGLLAEVMGVMRIEVRAVFPDMGRRRTWLRSLATGAVAEAALSGRPAEALAIARESLAHHARPPGSLEVVVATAEVEAITLGQAHILGEADQVVVAGEVSAAVLALARRDAPRIPWAETSPEALQAVALEGETVVVLCDTRSASAVRLALS